MSYATASEHETMRTVQAGIQKIKTQRAVRYWYLPHCTNSHWYYLQLDRVESTIIQSDPLNTRGTHYGKPVSDHLKEIHRIWQLQYKTIRRQHNGYDCGPYILNQILHEVQHTEDQIRQPSRTLIKQYLTENLSLHSFNREDTSYQSATHTKRYVNQCGDNRTEQTRQDKPNHKNSKKG